MLLEEPRPAPELAEQLGYMIKWVGDRTAKGAYDAFREHDLHPREFGVLTVLQAQSGLTQHELTEHVQIDPSTMVAVIDGLEDKGLAERRVAPEDRRKRVVYITTAGKAKLKRARPTVTRKSEQQFGVLTAAERDELLRLLRKVAGYEA